MTQHRFFFFSRLARHAATRVSKESRSCTREVHARRVECAVMIYAGALLRLAIRERSSEVARSASSDCVRSFPPLEESPMLRAEKVHVVARRDAQIASAARRRCHLLRCRYAIREPPTTVQASPTSPFACYLQLRRRHTRLQRIWGARMGFFTCEPYRLPTPFGEPECHHDATPNTSPSLSPRV